MISVYLLLDFANTVFFVLGESLRLFRDSGLNIQLNSCIFAEEFKKIWYEKDDIFDALLFLGVE